jgi:hypothetical protein
MLDSSYLCTRVRVRVRVRVSGAAGGRGSKRNILLA